MKPRWKIPILFALLVPVPLLIFATLSLHVVSVLESHERSRLSLEIEQSFFAHQYKTKPSVFCGSRLKSFIKWFQNSSDPISKLPNLQSKIQQKWNFRPDPYVFDSSGKLATPLSIPLPYRFAFQNLWKHLSEKPSHDAPLPKEDRKIFEVLFGSSFSISDWRGSENSILEVRFAGTDGFLIWSGFRGRRGGGIILVVRKIPDFFSILSSLAFSMTKENLVLFLSAGRNRFRCFGAPVPNGMQEIAQIMDKENAKEKFFENLLVRKEEILIRGNGPTNQLGETAIYFGRIIPPASIILSRKLLFAITLLLLFLSTVAFRKLGQPGQNVALSIKFKLIFLFIYSLAVSSAGTFFLGFNLLDDRRKVLGENVLRMAKEELTALDSSFIVERRRFTELCGKIRMRVFSGKNNPGSLELYLNGLLREKQLMHFEIRDLLGNLILPKERTATLESLGHFFDAFAKIAIFQTLTDRLASSEGVDFKMPDSKTREIIEGSELGFAAILSARNTPHPVNVSESQLLWYWDTNAKIRSQVAFITLIQSASSMQKSFLERQLPAGLVPGKNGIFKFALSQNASIRFPPDLKMGKTIISLLEKISISGRQIQSTVMMKGKDFLIIGQPGENLRDFFLFALIPVTEIAEAVKFLKYGVFLCVGSGILVALFIGSILSDHFLVPIGQLKRGMVALQRREVDYRVLVSSPDEFGELAQAFNLMIEDLKEMELAKIVQKSLVPSNLPEIPGYQVILKNMVANDLGGDYCDILPMPNGRFLFVIGDVTGHGVGAALGMALAKAVTFRFAREGDDPDVLLNRLNRILFEAFHRKKMMTFFAAVLSPETGIVRYSSAGHPFPYRKLSDGRVEEISQPSLPLGTGFGKSSYKSAEFEMNRGETLLFITDGLAEGTNKSNDQFGFETIRRTLGVESSENPENLLYNLFESFWAFKGNRELEDDLTVLILRRKSLNG
ncbi:SpoIIE family protein phosphatase [bacterium]|nr:SpoIIE family protein phosphatase [bacterium]